MPTTFHMADTDVTNLLARVMADHHPRLFDADVRVGVLMAYNADGPAVTGHGYPALASIKAVPLKDRLTKGYDAEMVIDAREFEGLREGQQEALIDHELSHIDRVALGDAELRARDPGDTCSWKVDDLGRPKLKTIKGDWHAGDGFALVVARHGVDAIEYENLARCKRGADAAREAGDISADVTSNTKGD